MSKLENPEARNDIYERGLRVPDAKTKSGYRLDRSKPADNDDKVLVPKGTKYWRWSINYGGTHISLTKPKPSQLTTSEFLSQAYDINDKLSEYSEATEASDIDNFIDEVKEEIQTLLDETQEKLDNMPEGLREGETGQLLQERVEACEEAISELEGIDVSYEELDPDDVEDGDPEEAEEDHLREWLDEKIGEVNEVQINV